MLRKILTCLAAITLILCITHDSLEAASYKSVLHKWTRSGRIYAFETLDADLLWSATLINDEMLTAQENIVKKQKIEMKVRRPEKNNIGFFVGAFAKNYLADFSTDENSVWKIYLITESGEEIKPVKIEKITKTATEDTFYPYVSRWRKCFWIEFPHVKLGDHFQLSARSIVENSTLKW